MPELQGGVAQGGFGLRPDAPILLLRGAYQAGCGFFGEAIPEAAMFKANSLALSGDLLLIIGSSMEVAPINMLPQAAKDNGAIIVESNLDHTHITDFLTDYFLPGPAGEVWPQVMKAVA